MSLRATGQIYPGLYGNGSLAFDLSSYVMNPTHAHRIILVNTNRFHESGGIEFHVFIEVDQLRKTILSKILTPDDLAEAYENIHHEIHGYDPRGLDPRDGRTRLKP